MAYPDTEVMANVITLLFVLGLPGFLMWAERKVKLIKWVSPIVWCYMAGILIANTPFLNPGIQFIKDITGISVGLAIPLLLFSTHLKKWLGQASQALLSFGLGTIGVLIASTLAFFLFSGRIEEVHSVSGMMIGVYTGGTPNMAAIGTALSVDEEVFALLNAADVLLGGLYFILLITILKPFLQLFLPAYRHSKETKSRTASYQMDDLQGRPTRIIIKNIGMAFLLAVTVFGLGLAFSSLIGGIFNWTEEEIDTKRGSWLILFITTAAIGLSFIPKVRTLKGTYRTAEYFLLAFAVTIGCMVDFQELVQQGPVIFMFCGFVMGLSILLHFLLAALFKIDADTVIITSTAGIFGPAFVGPVANAIKNPDIIVSGITMALLGYSFANYLGQAIAGLLSLF